MSNAELWKKVKETVAEIEAAKKKADSLIIKNGKSYTQVRVSKTLIRRRPVVE